jgi:hypothetical protein
LYFSSIYFFLPLSFVPSFLCRFVFLSLNISSSYKDYNILIFNLSVQSTSNYWDNGLKETPVFR